MQESAETRTLTSSPGKSGDLIARSASQSFHTTVTPHALVVVRGTRARVQSLTPYDGCAVVHLAPFDHEACPPAVIWPFDRVTSVETARDRWRRAHASALTFDVAHEIARSGIPAAVPRYGARLRVPPWQLAVAQAFDEGMATRVLLSDGVGLGKTVQAGFALAAIRLREPTARVLIACPAGLRDQWCDELTELFGFEPAPVDAAAIRTWRYRLPAGVNPWQVPHIAVTSIDFLKQPAVWRNALDARWDLLVVDEAHHATPGSDRHAAIAGLAGRAGLVLLITATPHAGDAHDFDALCRLGATDASSDPALFVRRSRADVGLASHRRVTWHQVVPTPRERELHEALLSYARHVWVTSAGVHAPRLAMTLLIKRASSSHEALLRSLTHRLRCLDRHRSADRIAVQSQLPFDGEGEFDGGDDEHAPALAAPGLPDVEREIALVARLVELASICVRSGDSKLAALRQLTARLQEPVVVFTEYRATLEAAMQAIAPVAKVAAMHGGCDRRARLAAVRDLAEGRASTLLATDVAGEGLNLHAAARTVVHLELPWTPTTIEQRVGRVDRIGQQRAVHVRHLVWRHALEGDVLRRLIRRAGAAGQAVGDGAVPDWLAVGAAILGIAPPAAEDLQPRTQQVRRFAQEDDCSLECGLRALALLQRLESRTGRPTPRARRARPAIRVRRAPRDPWAHSVVIVYRVAALAASGQVAAQVVVPVRVEFGSDALSRASRRVLLRAAHQAAASHALAASRDLLRRPIECYQRRMRVALVRAQDVHAAVAREYAAADQDPLLQPGLFDQRALTAAARKQAIVESAGRRLAEGAFLANAALDVRLPDTAEVIGALIVP